MSVLPDVTREAYKFGNYGKTQKQQLPCSSFSGKRQKLSVPCAAQKQPLSERQPLLRAGGEKANGKAFWDICKELRLAVPCVSG